MRGTVFFAAAAALLAAQPALAETLTVRLDQNTAVRLSAPARDVVIGNPNIADVNLLDARHLVVLGKAYGVTNLLVMDAAGRTILDRQVVVGSPDASMSYYRGGEARAYACTERCERVGGSGESSAAASGEAAAPAPTP
ncbi:pilus assembly protein N-terminal domain-containing protein [Phenylobacterium sp.]|jgi:Flp pilus assembly secretin CpaC|uniref:pilus assembly protein N-terminal domain-containing protein n=1 Tax=Phenylobacterium sp. TaxID=1871053 RepID=UPI002F3E9DB3